MMSAFRRVGLIAGLAALLSAAAIGLAAVNSQLVFQKHKLDWDAYEIADVGDVNRDGKLDIIAGGRWYEGPNWKPHPLRTIPKWDIHYDSFSNIAFDVNGDGFVDVITCFWQGKRLSWFENPGRDWDRREWKEHVIGTTDPVEFLFFVDLDGKGRRHALVPSMPGNREVIWYDYARDKNNRVTWTKHVVSPKGNGHGIGFGDINKDGRIDIITPGGWYEAPADIRQDAWTPHLEFKIGGDQSNECGNIYVYDVNDDGLSDIVTSAGHSYGVFWFEQKKDPAGNRTWQKHVIDNSWSQAHASALSDMNGDGVLDFVTGKRFYGHGIKDPGSLEPGILCWYELADRKAGKWVKHVIDYNTDCGVGFQLPVVDLKGDGRLDIIAVGKKGLFLFENVTRRNTH